MSHAIAVDEVEPRHRVGSPSIRLRAANVVAKGVFVSLLGLFVITAIPYGTAEAWWKAFFVCVVFALTMVWLVEGLLSESWIRDGWSLMLPILALALFSIIQTVQFGRITERPGEITLDPWNAISADPYQTRFFVLQIMALVFAGVLLFCYASSERRLRILIKVVIGVAVASAIFGIVRQTTQHAVGFGLPLIKPDQGYGQFINKNHFAYLMEMGFGLTLGMILGGGAKREHVLIYVAALLSVWSALVLCGSRGALIAMVAQVITAGLIFGAVVHRPNSTQPLSKLIRVTRSLPVRLAMLVILLIGVVFGTLWLGGDRLASRIEESRNEFSQEFDDTRSRVSRNEIWRASLKMFAANPVFGVGMGAYWAAIPTYHDGSGTSIPQAAHNDYLELLASGGLVGMAIGLWFAVAVFRRTRKNLRSANRFRRAACFGAAIGMVGVAVHSLVDFGLHTIVNALAFTALIVIATSTAPWANQISGQRT